MEKGWKKRKLDELIDNFIDYRGATPEKSESGIPLITAKIVKNGFIQKPDEYISGDVYQEWMTRGIPNENDVVLTTEAPLGEVARITTDNPVALAQRIITLQGREGVLDNTFLKFCLQSEKMQNRLWARASGSTVQGIKQSELRKVEIDLPPLPTQRRIADILGALDDKTELNRRMNETLEEMAQTLYYRYFDGSVERGDIGLEELVEIKPRMPVPDDDEVLTYVGMADVEPNRMSVTDYGEKEYTSGRRFVNYDTLMARITPSLENGKTAFVDFLDDGEMAFGSTEFTVMRAREDTSPYFVYCCARDERFREYAISTMTGSSGRQRVQENLLGEYGFEDFDQSRMDQFHDRVEPLFKLIRSNTSENQTLAETRDYLLPKLISKEIEVDAAQEVAEDTVHASA